MEHVETKMKELVDKLNTASKKYYSDDEELMTNKEYDDLLDELRQMEKDSGIHLPDSPVNRVGYEVISNLPKRTHRFPSLSLDKTKEISDLEDFLGDKEGILSIKEDGLTVVATYKRYKTAQCNTLKLVELVTRGNGEVGESIIHNAPYIKGLPTVIESLPFPTMDMPEEVIIRGECMISYSDFDEINKGMAEPYKNPRNLASGSVRLFDSEEASKRHLQMVAFDLVYADPVPEKWDFAFTVLQEWGFQVVPHKLVIKDTIADSVKEFAEKVTKEDLPSDGLVLHYNDIPYGRSLGSTGHHPRNGIAFKWQDETYPTILRDVEWSASRTGLLNPVAIFDPVEIEGTTVSRASVHNLRILEDLDMGIGSEIAVYKANLIIPQISHVSVHSETAKLEIPANCPVCNGLVERRVNSDNTSEALYCKNPNCAAKQIGKFVRFCEKDSMNIGGMAESIINTLIQHGIITRYRDFYHMEEHPEIAVIDGFGEKSYKNMLLSANNSREVSFVAFLHAMGIPNIGKGQAKLLKQHLDFIYPQYKMKDYNLVMFLKMLVEMDYDFSVIDGFGDVIVKSLNDWVYTYLIRPVNLQLVQSDPAWEVIDLLEELSFTDTYVEKNEGTMSLNGKVFVITGSLNHFKNRDALVKEIESMGGKVSGSVSSKTSYLINNDVTSTSGKNKKAKELNVPIISEETLLDMIGGK